MIKYKAETALSLLVAITLFAIVVLSFSQWQSAQNHRLNQHFQQQQAVMILEKSACPQISRVRL